MDEKQALAGILRDLVELAGESADVRAGRLSEEEYRQHCELTERRIEKAFPVAETAQPTKA